ncbi:MAG: hypothetical protein WC208_09380 [Gallionella sp.]|jgi:hypothetical protein
MYLRKLFLALLIASIAPSVSAMSLGEGRILSFVGESLSANVALLGDYSSDVKFYQVRNAECRSSIIATTANGCDSLYEGALTLTIKRRPDGQYFLKLTGERGNELFYRVLIKSVSANGGTVYNAFEFLPEFKANPDALPVVESNAESVLPAGKYGLVGGKMIEVVPDDEGRTIGKSAPAQSAPVKARLPDESRQRHAAQPVEAIVKKPSETRLQIKKYGEYADDIHALQKENGEIEEQIVLLEKHIGLLKEVIRLKSQVDASAVVEVGVAAPVRVRTPAVVPVQSQLTGNNEPGLLTWILLAVVVVMAALLGWMYRKMNSLSLKGNVVEPDHAVTSTSSLNEIKSLDLTSSFVKPKW